MFLLLQPIGNITHNNHMHTYSRVLTHTIHLRPLTPNHPKKIITCTYWHITPHLPLNHTNSTYHINGQTLFKHLTTAHTTSTQTHQIPNEPYNLQTTRIQPSQSIYKTKGHLPQDRQFTPPLPRKVWTMVRQRLKFTLDYPMLDFLSFSFFSRLTKPWWTTNQKPWDTVNQQHMPKWQEANNFKYTVVRHGNACSINNIY